MNQEVLGEIEIDLPTKDEQKKAIDCIYPIIRKIEINNAVNDNLQQMAHTTYMHLFFNKPANGRISDILIENSKSSIQVGEAKDVDGDYEIYFVMDELKKDFPTVTWIGGHFIKQRV